MLPLLVQCCLNDEIRDRISENMRGSSNISSMLSHSLSHSPNIEPNLGECIEFRPSGYGHSFASTHKAYYGFILNGDCTQLRR